MTTARIAELNDQLRTTMLAPLGRVVMTGAVANHDRCEDIITAVRQFNTFDESNDPYGEHDFGTFEIGADRVIWKIDYYDKGAEFGSENPADPSVTTRVLTIMLAEEY